MRVAAVLLAVMFAIPTAVSGWGTMLKELERPGLVAAHPAVLAPLVALALCVAALHAVIPPSNEAVA